MNLNISLDQRAIEALIASSGATERQTKKATISALRKLRRNVRTLVKRQMSKELGIPQKAFAKRVYGSTVDTDGVLTIWIGTNPISPYAIGDPVKNKTGVKVGRYRTFTGAFIAKVFGDKESVWIRASSKHYSPALYPSSSSRSYNDWRVGIRAKYRNRFPVVKVGIPIEEGVTRVIENNREAIGDLFMRRLEQELNYHVNVRGQA